MRTGIIILALIVLSSCAREQKRTDRETIAMDSFVKVSVFDSPVDDGETERRINRAIDEIRRIDTLASDYIGPSPVNRINAGSGHLTISVSPELTDLLAEGLRFGRTSDGALNIAIGPLVQLWDFSAAVPRIPPRASIDSVLQLTDPDDILVAGSKVFLKQEGMRLDFGAIAKGYAVDRALTVLRGEGLSRAIVDIGGNLGVRWDDAAMRDTSAALIYVRHPRINGEMFGMFKVGNCGIATSGDYQKFFEIDGKRYHHVLDPSTGHPAHEVVSVTILASTAMRADALSTIVFVRGKEAGMATIEREPDVEGLIIYQSGDTLSWLLSSGFPAGFVRAGGDAHR